MYKRISLISLFFLLFIASAAAQIRATTETGNHVILYENGTWSYEETPINRPVSAPETVDLEGSVIQGEKTQQIDISINKAKNAETEKVTLFDVASPKLARYFGETNGRMRCAATCINNKGEVRVRLEWCATVGDANRYFGYIREGSKLVFHLADMSAVELQYGTDNQVKFYEKYGLSYYTSTIVLSEDVIAKLISSPLVKMTMAWKKDIEAYDVENVNYFVANLPSIL